MIGWLSDRTNSRNWGRRYPWMLWAAIPRADVLFAVDCSDSESDVAVYFLCRRCAAV
ncbi:hypothetical protein VZG47_12585 [Synechococcus elongatus IITB5]